MYFILLKLTESEFNEFEPRLKPVNNNNENNNVTLLCVLNVCLHTNFPGMRKFI